MTELNAEEIDKEVLPFLSLDARPHVRAIAMQYFLGLTGKAEGLEFIASKTKYLSAIVAILEDEHTAISKDAFLSLVNLTTDANVCAELLSLESEPNLLIFLLKYVLKKENVHTDIACMVLSNLSRSVECAEKIVELMVREDDQVGFGQVISVFCHEDEHSARLHYLGPFLSNLTQIKGARKYILDKERCVLQRLLPYTEYQDSVIRRGGIVGTLRNCCFETEYHEWLLCDTVDILPRLLLPLAGPEEFDDDDTEKLPEDLQYLEPDKKREADPDIRKMLLEAILQLCALKPCRQFIKDKNTYVILRELHKWEQDPAALAAVENLVQLLIADEPEEGMDDLSKVDIPQDIQEKLNKAYEAQQADIEKQTRELESSSKNEDGQTHTKPSTSGSENMHTEKSSSGKS